MVKKNGKTLLERALDYHRRRWCIIPIGKNKKAAVRWKQYQTTRPDEKQLREWFSNGEYTSLAVVCGAVSGGLAVLDLDSEARCQWWRKEHSVFAEFLPTAETKKGLHVYFRSEPFRKQNGDEVDLLGEGACAILPPSPEKQWLKPLDGELPLHDPFEWGLEQFGINRPEPDIPLPEETEDTEEPEDSERHRSHSGVVFSLDSLDDEIKKEVERAIEATQPTKEGQRNDAIMPLCQWLKAIPELKDLSAKALKPIIKQWHEQAYNVIGTKPFTDTWRDFVHAWKRVKWPKGDVMLAQAIRMALKSEKKLPEEQEYDTEEAQYLLRVCYFLQEIIGNEPFFLASRTAGGILGISRRDAYKLLEMFVADEKLKLIEKHTSRKAPRYRYIAN